MFPTFRWLTLLLVVLACSSLEGAVPPAKMPAKIIDFSKLPPGTIFIIGDDAKDVLAQPGVIVLTPEKFKEMLDQIDQLKKQVNPDKPDTPSRCKLNGRIEGDLVHLRAEFEFETRKRKAQVALGCQKAWPTAATLDDGRLPLLPPPGDDGFTVQIDQPGTHRLTLELELPVTPRGAKGTDRGFDLGLPRAAITLVESLDAPDTVRELRFGARQVAAKDISSKNGQRKLVALGPVERLDVSWKGPAPQRQADPILSAQGQIDVRVDDTHVTTEAELTLNVEIGQTLQWQIQAAPEPLVKLEVDRQAGDERVREIVPPAADAKNPIWTIKLKEASAEPVKVRIRARQPRAGKPLAIGPFAVLQTVRQHGTITVSVPPDLRPRFRTRGEVSQREVPEDLRRGANTVAAFAYWNLPAAAPNQPVPSALEVDLETVKGAIETSVTHSLRLTDQGWQVSSEIDVNPVRTSVERFEVELPGDYELKASPALLVEPDLEIKDAAAPKKIGIVKLAQKRAQPFKVVLDGQVVIPEGKQSVIVPLPRPLQTLDKGGKITVSVPEGMELRVARETGTDTLTPGKREQSWRPERAPARVELAWRTHRPEFPVAAVVDVTIGERQILVRQQLRFQGPTDALRDLVFRSMDFPADRLPSADRVTLTPRGANAWVATLKEPSLTLDYALPLPPAEKNNRARRLALPLIWPEAATRCLMKVRVWSGVGAQAVLASGPWEELPTEVVPERDSLPSLVLRGNGVQRGGSLEFPLVLSLTEAAGAPLATIAVERILIQAVTTEGGPQSYRARFLLSRIGTRTLDVELPGSPPVLNLDVFLDGKRLSTVQTIDDDGKETDNGRIARLRIEPELYRKPVVLELRYQVPAGLLERSWQTTFYPPQLRGNVMAGQVRWQVALPGAWVPLHVGGRAMPEQRWGLRGGLPALRPAATTLEVQRWFNGDLEPHTGEADAETVQRVPEIVCGQAALAPLPVVYAAQQTLLLACALIALGFGLALYFLPLRRGLFWGSLAGLLLLASVAFLSWPRAVLVVGISSMPGLAILLVVIGAQWFLQRHYRRQIVFMPGFTRLAPGSSIVRGGSSQRRREPSTVDAPPGVVAEGGSGAVRLPGRAPSP